MFKKLLATLTLLLFFSSFSWAQAPREGVPVSRARAYQFLEQIQNDLKYNWPHFFSQSIPIEIHLAPPNRLDIRSGGVHTQALFDPNNHKLWLNQNTHEPQAFATIAHEYAHAWQFGNHPHPDQLSDVFSEGLAQWLSYRVCQRMGYHHLAHQIASRQDALYGKGFRWFDRLSREMGEPFTLQVALYWLDENGRDLKQLEKEYSRPSSRAGGYALRRDGSRRSSRDLSRKEALDFVWLILASELQGKRRR